MQPIHVFHAPAPDQQPLAVQAPFVTRMPASRDANGPIILFVPEVSAVGNVMYSVRRSQKDVQREVAHHVGPQILIIHYVCVCVGRVAITIGSR